MRQRVAMTPVRLVAASGSPGAAERDQYAVAGPVHEREDCEQRNVGADARDVEPRNEPVSDGGIQNEERYSDKHPEKNPSDPGRAASLSVGGLVEEHPSTIQGPLMTNQASMNPVQSSSIPGMKRHARRRPTASSAA
jgi:hypothetical protein